MTEVLVAYGSGEGQTAKAADRVGSVLRERGHDVTLYDVSEAPEADVETFDAVVVGAPVNNRRHRPEVVAFVEANREALASRPTAFFQLSFASVLRSAWAREGAGEFAADLFERTGWHPDRVGLFAGAVKYSQYDRTTRAFFRLFSALTTGDTDTSRDYEYTDWDHVERFAAAFADVVDEATATGTAGERASDGTANAGRRWGRCAAAAVLVAGLSGVAYWFVRERLLGPC